MGLSASQSRMLTLTARLSDLELKSQRIQESKVRLAEQSTQASKDYMDALDAQKLRFNWYSTGSVDATVNTITESGLYRVADAFNNYYTKSTQDMATYQEFTTPGGNRVMIYSDGSVTVRKGNTSISANSSGKLTKSVTDATTRTTTTTDLNATNAPTPSVENTDLGVIVSVNKTAGTVTIYEGNKTYTLSYNSSNKVSSFEAKTRNDDGSYKIDAREEIATIPAGEWYAFNPSDGSAVKASEQKMNDSAWLFEQLQLANLFIQKWDSDKGWQDFSYTSSSLFTTEDDDTNVAKAEATYEFTMAEIQEKDKRFDLELDAITTEHEAVKQEMESVKSVVKDNIQKSFTVFS